jgi:hypothetical protein
VCVVLSSPSGTPSSHEDNLQLGKPTIERLAANMPCRTKTKGKARGLAGVLALPTWMALPGGAGDVLPRPGKGLIYGQEQPDSASYRVRCVATSPKRSDWPRPARSWRCGRPQVAGSMTERAASSPRLHHPRRLHRLHPRCLHRLHPRRLHPRHHLQVLRRHPRRPRPSRRKLGSSWRWASSFSSSTRSWAWSCTGWRPANRSLPQRLPRRPPRRPRSPGRHP